MTQRQNAVFDLFPTLTTRLIHSTQMFDTQMCYQLCVNQVDHLNKFQSHNTCEERWMFQNLIKISMRSLWRCSRKKSLFCCGFVIQNEFQHESFIIVPLFDNMRYNVKNSRLLVHVLGDWDEINMLRMVLFQQTINHRSICSLFRDSWQFYVSLGHCSVAFIPEASSNSMNFVSLYQKAKIASQ